MTWRPMEVPASSWTTAELHFRRLEPREPSFGAMSRLCEHVAQQPYGDLVFCALSMHTLLVSQHAELEWDFGVLRIDIAPPNEVIFMFWEQPFVEPASWRCETDQVVTTFEGFLRRNKWVSASVLPEP